MKICKNCSYQNDDDFIYCQECGERLDGKKICFNCKKEVPGEAKFCGFCGSNLTSEKKTKENKKQINIFSLVTKCAYLLVMILIVIGVFTPILKISAGLSSSEVIAGKIDIFYFMQSEYWDSVITSEISMNYELNEVVSHNISLIAPAIFIYISALATLTFTIIAIVKNVISLIKSEDKVSHKWNIVALLLYFVLIFGTAFVSLGLWKENVDGITIGTSFAGMPITIIVISLCLGLSYKVYRLILNYNEMDKNRWIIVSFNFASFVLLFISLFLMCGNILNQPGAIYVSIISLPAESVDFSLVGAIFLYFISIGAFFDLIISCVNMFVNFDCNFSKKNLIRHISAYIGMILLFIFTFIYLRPLFIFDYYDVKYSAGFIIFIVFIAISLGLNIASFIISRKLKK